MLPLSYVTFGDTHFYQTVGLIKQIRECSAFIRWHTFIDGDTEEEYYKYNLEKEYYYLFLFQPYYHNMKEKYQQTPLLHLQNENKGHFQLYLLSKGEYWHLSFCHETCASTFFHKKGTV